MGNPPCFVGKLWKITILTGKTIKKYHLVMALMLDNPMAAMGFQKVVLWEFMGVYGSLWDFPSGKRRHNGKIHQFLLGKLTIKPKWPCAIAM